MLRSWIFRDRWVERFFGSVAIRLSAQSLPHFLMANAVKVRKNCSQLTPDRDEGDAALCLPPARAGRVSDHPRLTYLGGQNAWALGAPLAVNALGAPSQA